MFFRPQFGRVVELTSDNFVKEIDKENAQVTVIVHIYDKVEISHFKIPLIHVHIHVMFMSCSVCKVGERRPNALVSSCLPFGLKSAFWGSVSRRRIPGP